MDRKTEADRIPSCERSRQEIVEEFDVSSEASTDFGSDGDRSEDEPDSRSTYNAHTGTGERRSYHCADEDDKDATAGCPLDSVAAEVSVATPSRPRFARVSRGQRLAQLAKLVEEFCNLDFNTVDASAQSAVVLRMLALLRSLRHMEVYHDREGTRCTEERYALLGLAAECTEMMVLDKMCRQAEVLVDDRSFRPAFELLCEARPLFIRCCQDVGTACGRPPLNDDQAMALRRWLRKQKQREERRHQRATDRAEKPCRVSAQASTFAGLAEILRPNTNKWSRSHPRT